MAPHPLPRIAALAPYVPGRSIEEIQEKYGLDQVIKLASNENPLGASPLVQEAIRRYAASAFRYPQGGNPRLVQRLAARHGIEASRIAIGNGSDEVIDMLLRMLAEPGQHNIVCSEPCFSIYPIQAAIGGIECRRMPLNADFSPDFPGLLRLVDAKTRLVFITAPDNPSGYCPPLEDVLQLAADLENRVPEALLVVDEAYMDFVPDEAATSCLASGKLPGNAAVLRTFSKSYGLAGLRVGYGVLPAGLADAFWRARLPFSVNILAEEAALAALADDAFRQATLAAVAAGRDLLTSGLREAGCQVWPSSANFIMFRLPQARAAADCFEFLLCRGIIVRPLKSYNLPEHLRVSIGTAHENRAFLAALNSFLGAPHDGQENNCH